MSQPLLAKGNDVFSLAIELPGFVSLAAQVALANMTRIALLTIDNAFLGHLGTTALAAASLATVWIQVPLFSVWAMSSSLVTLCGQAYGAQNYRLMGIWLQMALVLVSVLSLPVIWWYWSIEFILSRASDDREVVVYGVVFSRIMSLSIWPALAYACLRQYLQAMHIVAPTTIIGIVSIGIAVLANNTLIYGFNTWSGFGFEGSALATVIASWFQPIALFSYGFLYKKYHKQAWGGWSLAEHTKSRWKTFLTMALPLGLNDGLTFLANSCMALIVAQLGVQILASNAIFLTLWVMLWALSFGVGCATQIKVATHLGAGHAVRARATSQLGFCIVLLSTSIVIIILWLCRYVVLHIFTSDADLVHNCVSVLPLYLCAYAFDALEITMTAILNGMGEMPFVSGVSLFGMWGVQLPLAYAFAIVYNLGLHGIWISYCFTALFKLSALSLKYCNINWNVATLKAMSAMEAIEEEENLIDEEALLRLHRDSSQFRLECAIPSPANAVLEGGQEGIWWHHKEVTDLFILQFSLEMSSEKAPLLAVKPTDVFDLKSELMPYLSLAFQMALANIARIALVSIDSAFLGHLGTNALAGSSLATLWTQVPLNCVWAMASALITLCGQAYGAKNYNLMGIWFQMALLLVSVLMIPVFVWYWTLDVVLRHATDDTTIIALGLRFAQLLSFSIWPALVYVCMRQYLQAMNLVAPTTIIGTMAIFIAIGANSLLIYGAGSWNGLGFDGSALATVVASWFQPISLFLYAFAYKGYHKQAWGGWKWSAFTKERWITFLHMALPLGLNDGFSTLANSCMSLIAAKLGAEILASNAILLTLWSLIWALFWGVACSTQVKVAHHLGAGHPKAARSSSYLGLVAIVFVSLFMAAVSYVGRNHILSIYTSDSILIAHCLSVLPLFILGFTLDALEITLTAVLEGMGQMPFVSGLAFIAMWGIQLPMSYLFAIVWGHGFAGLWYGICSTAAFKLFVLTIKYVTINWDLMALHAIERVEATDDWTLQPTCAIASPANALLTTSSSEVGFHHSNPSQV